MNRIGVIAPKWSTDRIKEAIDKVNIEYLAFEHYTFNRLEEIGGILEARYKFCDYWLLSGPLPYSVAIYYLGERDNVTFIETSEAGIAIAILSLINELKYKDSKISIDYIKFAGDLDVIINEVGYSDDIFIKNIYDIPVDEDDILDFHIENYNSGAKFIITTLPYVYNRLKEMNIPTVGVKATKTEIKSAIDYLIEQYKKNYYKDKQIAMIIIDILESRPKQDSNIYDDIAMELSISRDILQYCKSIGGYMVNKGKGRYEIFASIGIVKKRIDELKNIVDKISVKINSKTVVGIGIGTTVYMSQNNAIKALSYSDNRNKIVLIDEKGQIVENLGYESELLYNLYENDDELNSLLSKANVSIGTYQKLKALIQINDWNYFTADQVAKELDVTPRNTRRILKDLFEVGILEVIGKESSFGKGRPANVYRFTR
ncbi:hypothetical protein [Tissierella praeacuta]|uniref:hypothetical protein n=1 Tax=Tissierella praeacuta TaxID=43131 RepID=UPI001C11F63B|nr:hypothetical protein [Tissierella praeacuta]MBU5254730.1 hypothetical protein [Tissierella praeacuta]